jgi:hypothetical protein
MYPKNEFQIHSPMVNSTRFKGESYSTSKNYNYEHDSGYDNKPSINALKPSLLNRSRFNEALIKVNRKSQKMTNQFRSGPSIPGKTIKILKSSPHAHKVNKFLEGTIKMNQSKHKRGFSFQKDLNNTFSKEDVALLKKSRPASIMKEKRKGFTTSSYRFDKKADFERFYDSTPGPGSYNLITKD